MSESASVIDKSSIEWKREKNRQYREANYNDGPRCGYVSATDRPDPSPRQWLEAAVRNSIPWDERIRLQGAPPPLLPRWFSNADVKVRSAIDDDLLMAAISKKHKNNRKSAAWAAKRLAEARIEARAA